MKELNRKVAAPHTPPYCSSSEENVPWQVWPPTSLQPLTQSTLTLYNNLEYIINISFIERLLIKLDSKI